MKVAVIGAGSFVFGMSVLAQGLVETPLPGAEFALMDVDADAVEAMAAVGRRIAAEHGSPARVTAHTTRDSALDSADFVINSACRQLHRRFATDCEIVDRLAPGHLITEFGGVAGISYSLRQIALIEELCDDLLRLCPDAWLLNAANPLPRVAQAAHERGARTAGFCAVTLEGYGMIWRLLHGEPLPYPFTAARERLEVLFAGVNHFSWTLEVRDRNTGADLLPLMRGNLKDGATSGSPRSDALARETGYLLVPNDGHTRDFLPPTEQAASRRSPGHGSANERAERLQRLRDVAEGRAPWRDLYRQPAWEKPIAFIAALTGGPEAEFHALDLVNAERQIANLPPQVFVETPCRVTTDGPAPARVTLPEPVAPYVRRAADVTDAIVKAARTRSRAHLREAVALDPTIEDKDAGMAALDACLEAHADLLPPYR